MARIIVIGGHGKVALQLAGILTGRADAVSSVFRNPDHSDDVAATGAKPVQADIEQLDTIAVARLLAGHDAVVFSAGAGGGNPAGTYAVDRDAAIRVIDAAAQAGVKRFVMVSYFGAGPVPTRHRRIVCSTGNIFAPRGDCALRLDRSETHQPQAA
jgi:uncharacterized protein YbjT (DUF2867 family)